MIPEGYEVEVVFEPGSNFRSAWSAKTTQRLLALAPSLTYTVLPNALRLPSLSTLHAPRWLQRLIDVGRWVRPSPRHREEEDHDWWCAFLDHYASHPADLDALLIVDSLGGTTAALPIVQTQLHAAGMRVYGE